jgi:hypothetical protein
VTRSYVRELPTPVDPSVTVAGLAVAGGWRPTPDAPPTCYRCRHAPHGSRVIETANGPTDHLGRFCFGCVECAERSGRVL